MNEQNQNSLVVCEHTKLSHTRIGHRCIVDGNLFVNNNCVVQGDITGKSDCEIYGNQHILGNLIVEGTSTLNDAVTVADGKPTTLGGTLTVKGTSTLNDAVTVADGKPTTLGGTLTVKDAATINSSLTVQGFYPTNLDGDLKVLGNVQLGYYLYPLGAPPLPVGGYLTVLGETNLQKKLNMNSQLIQNLANAVDSTDAMNRQSVSIQFNALVDVVEKIILHLNDPTNNTIPTNNSAAALKYT